MNNDMTIRNVLIRARGLISGGWCKGAFKRDNQDTGGSVQYCLDGALYEAAGGLLVKTSSGYGRSTFPTLYTQAKAALGGFYIWLANDTANDVGDILALLDKAINSLPALITFTFTPALFDQAPASEFADDRLANGVSSWAKNTLPSSSPSAVAP